MNNKNIKLYRQSNECQKKSYRFALGRLPTSGRRGLSKTLNPIGVLKQAVSFNVMLLLVTLITPVGATSLFEQVIKDIGDQGKKVIDQVTGKKPAPQAEPSTPTESANTSLSRVEVKELQRGLTALGFDPGPPDGLVVKRTESAASKFRHERGLSGYQTIDAPLLREVRATLVEYTGSSQTTTSLQTTAPVGEPTTQPSTTLGSSPQPSTTAIAAGGYPVDLDEIRVKHPMTIPMQPVGPATAGCGRDEALAAWRCYQGLTFRSDSEPTMCSPQTLDLCVRNHPEVHELPYAMGEAFTFTGSGKTEVSKNSSADFPRYFWIIFSAPPGTAVYSVQSGVVERVVDERSGTAHALILPYYDDMVKVLIRHPDGGTGWYRYLNRDLLIRAGQQVQAGEPIGYLAHNLPPEDSILVEELLDNQGNSYLPLFRTQWGNNELPRLGFVYKRIEPGEIILDDPYFARTCRALRWVLSVPKSNVPPSSVDEAKLKDDADACERAYRAYPEYHDLAYFEGLVHDALGDKTAAVKPLKAAMDGGYAPAIDALAVIASETFQDDVAALEAAAHDCNHAAQFELGLYYVKGLGGVEKDYFIGTAWVGLAKQVAQQDGDAEAAKKYANYLDVEINRSPFNPLASDDPKAVLGALFGSPGTPNGSLAQVEEINKLCQ